MGNIAFQFQHPSKTQNIKFSNSVDSILHKKTSFKFLEMCSAHVFFRFPQIFTIRISIWKSIKVGNQSTRPNPNTYNSEYIFGCMIPLECTRWAPLVVITRITTSCEEKPQFTIFIYKAIYWGLKKTPFLTIGSGPILENPLDSHRCVFGAIFWSNQRRFNSMFLPPKQSFQNFNALLKNPLNSTQRDIFRLEEGQKKPTKIPKSLSFPYRSWGGKVELPPPKRNTHLK